MNEKLNKWLIKLLKKLLRKLGGVKRVEYTMSEKEKVEISEMNAIRKRYESESFLKSKKSVEIESDYPNKLSLFFEHNFKVKFDNIPPYLFKKVRKIGEKTYEFEFFIAKYGNTDTIKKMKEMGWKSNVENKIPNISIEIFNGNEDIFKTVKLDNCKIESVRCFENLEYNGSELLTGVVNIVSESITIG